MLLTYKIGVVGPGTIGRRIIESLNKHPDYEVIGVAKTSKNNWPKDLFSKYNFYVSDKIDMKKYSFGDTQIRLDAKLKEFSEFNPAGTLIDLILRTDLIVDATPKKVGIKNKELYENEVIKKTREELGLNPLKVIYQGGEKSSVAEMSFIANPCYDKVEKNINSVRCVSCNTTGMGRIVYQLIQNNKIPRINRIYNTLVRRSIDPSQKKGSFIDAFKAEANSHHGEDLKTIFPQVKIGTNAFAVPMSHFHGHSIIVQFEDAVESEDVQELLLRDDRIAVINPKEFFSGDLFELSRKYHNQDAYVVAAQIKKISDFDDTIAVLAAVPQESIVIPESIDAINALLTNKTKNKSMNETDELLGIPRIKENLEYLLN